MKNHPTQEQWMEYLYGEMQSPERKALEAHVKGCAPCQEQKQAFTGTMKTLDEWRVETAAKHSLADARSRFQPVVKWAAAAALLVTTGFVAARFSLPRVDVEALEAKVTAQVEANFKTKVQEPFERRINEEVEALAEEAVALVREKVQIEMAAQMQEITMRAQSEIELAVRDQMEELEVQLAGLHADDRKKMNQAMKAFETQWLAEYRRLREDLERVALFSDESFRKAQRQLVQLASYTQPEAIDQLSDQNESEN